MKPPNHGCRVRVTDPSLGIEFIGRPVLMSKDTMMRLSFGAGNYTGLGLISERSGVVQAILRRDRIEVIR